MNRNTIILCLVIACIAVTGCHSLQFGSDSSPIARQKSELKNWLEAGDSPLQGYPPAQQQLPPAAPHANSGR